MALTPGLHFFGGAKSSGPFDGLQAEKARIPFANVRLVKLPDEVDDDLVVIHESSVITANAFAITTEQRQSIVRSHRAS